MKTTVKVPPRQRLSAERMHRRWSQLEVADQLGTTAGNVSRWERGITSPGPYFRRKLCELFGRSSQELGLTWDESDEFLSHNIQASSMVAFFPRNEPLSSTLFFTERENLLEQVRTLLRPNTTAALLAVPANSGLGELNFPAQENLDEGWLAQTITQWLQTQQNWMLIVDNEVSALVIPNITSCSQRCL